jgi:formate C-acetyltransferase
MKEGIKKYIKSIPLVNIALAFRHSIACVYAKEYRNCKVSKLKKYSIYMRILFTHTFVVSSNPIRKIHTLLTKAKINDDQASPFFYSLDTSMVMLARKSVIGNMTPDYTILLENSISDLINKYDASRKIAKTAKEVSAYCERCIAYVKQSNNAFKGQKLTHLTRLLTHTPETFYEALQRILFTNQLIWQEGHSLIGLGHLDKLLYPYYEHDIQTNMLTREKVSELIKEFLKILHNAYTYKSSVLLGDTGQIIVLGGLDEHESFICNDVTYLFIQAITELQLPDPKILLRVHRTMPIELLKASVMCIQTGVGCPLFANDEIIIPALVNFGYDKNDVYDYGASACWEPFIIGKSSDANNIASLNFIEPLQRLLFSEQGSSITTYEEMIAIYKQQLQLNIQKLIDGVFILSWENAPLLSLFMEDCAEKNLDIADGGAKYNNYGITTVALANTINSLLNIKKYIYELRLLTMQELKTILLNNYNGREDIQKLFKNEQIRYGVDDDEVLAITNDILAFTTQVMNEYIPDTNRKIKFGVSSPNYISGMNNSPATPDGRNKDTSFAVHISNDRAVDFTGLFSFASKIDYTKNRFNGNVIDSIVSPHFIKNNFEQFVSMIYASFLSGIFEMQFNVINSDTLIQAKKTPEQFQHLIVRVWGFSAYFNDLPETYKDVLIERTREHEYAYH